MCQPKCSSASWKYDMNKKPLISSLLYKIDPLSTPTINSQIYVLTYLYDLEVGVFLFSLPPSLPSFPPSFSHMLIYINIEDDMVNGTTNNIYLLHTYICIDTHTCICIICIYSHVYIYVCAYVKVCS